MKTLQTQFQFLKSKTLVLFAFLALGFSAQAQFIFTGNASSPNTCDGYLEGAGNDLNIVEIDANGIFLYPNPATDELRINNAESVNHYQIFDMSGALALEGNTFPIAIEPLSQGAYMVRLALNNNQVSNHKILIK